MFESLRCFYALALLQFVNPTGDVLHHVSGCLLCRFDWLWLFAPHCFNLVRAAFNDFNNSGITLTCHDDLTYYPFY